VQNACDLPALPAVAWLQARHFDVLQRAAAGVHKEATPRFVLHHAGRIPSQILLHVFWQRLALLPYGVVFVVAKLPIII
jgi:hypothetical protein